MIHMSDDMLDRIIAERATIVNTDIPPGMQSSGFLRTLIKQKASKVEPDARIDISAGGLLKVVADADRCAELTAEVTRLTELWMDAIHRRAERNQHGRLITGYPETTPRSVFAELEKRGLAEGNDRDGWVLKWPEKKR